MLKELRDLLVLQDRDTALLKLKAEMAGIPKDVEREQAKLKNAQSELELSKEELKQLELKAGQLKLDRRTRQDTHEKLKVQQFETKKNDEYAALGAEADRYAAMVSELETEELELLEKVDDLTSLASDKEKTLTETKSNVAQSIEDLKEKARQMMARYKEAQTVRASAAGEVEGSALSLYERVFKAKGDFAVASLEEGVCHGCSMKVVATTVSQVKVGDSLVQCENCARILHEI